MKAKCDALDAFLDAIEVPATLPPSRKRAQMVEFVTTMSDYFCPKGPEATKLNTACLNAISDLGTQKAECDKNQAAFESGFCTWRTQIIDTRSALDKCYSSAAASHGELVDTTKGNVAKWKTEYTSLKKIVCYTDVWLNNNDASTVDSNMFEKCKSQTIDTSPMDIEYPTVPPQADCPTTKVDIFPGSAAFPTTEYKDFLGFVVDVIPCATAGPDAGHGFDGKYIVNWLIQKDHQPQKSSKCGLDLDDTLDAKHLNGGGDWVKYFKSGTLNAGCGGACNGDDGVNMECHYGGASNSGIRNVEGYAKTTIFSDADKTAELQVGSDDGIAVWLNGDLALSQLSACHCYGPNQYRSTLSLKKGANELVVKVGENDGHFGFVAAFGDATGLAAAI